MIDDLQWADLDSIALIEEIVRTPDAPNLLLIATLRTNAGHTGTEVNLKLQQIPGVRHLHIEPLPPEHAEELVSRLSSGGDASFDVSKIAEDTGGHPLFIAELVRYAHTGGADRDIRLDDALKARIDSLAEPARRVLELLSASGRPLTRKTVARAADMELDQLISNVEFLRTENLVRTSGTRQSDNVETYHDRVREVVAKCSKKRHSHLHERLALALEAVARIRLRSTILSLG